MRISPVIFGCKSTVLSQAERDFFRARQPWGFILFGRNIENPDQVRKLVDDLKSCVDHEDVAVLIDQEGGRVRRLRPPHWNEYHSGQLISRHYKSDPERGKRIAWLQSRLMAFDLRELGINVDCLPVLDVPVSGAHDVIGDRAYGHDPDTVTVLGERAAQGLLDGGVVAVMKHIPGHGRSLVDSHHDLPRVGASLEELEVSDFEPFRRLSHLPAAMTAHVIYEAIDSDAPATTSASVIETIIRGHIGFDGLLMCDDLSMRALSGDFAERTKTSFAAGCDVVLHCNGEMDEMIRIADALPEFGEAAFKRAGDAALCWSSQDGSDRLALSEEFNNLCRSSDYETDPTETMV